jgi:hypothetical protein
LIEDRPKLVAAVRPLLDARKAIERQVGDLDRKVHKLARHDAAGTTFPAVSREPCDLLCVLRGSLLRRPVELGSRRTIPFA